MRALGALHHVESDGISLLDHDPLQGRPHHEDVFVVQLHGGLAIDMAPTLLRVEIFQRAEKRFVAAGGPLRCAAAASHVTLRREGEAAAASVLRRAGRAPGAPTEAANHLWIAQAPSSAPKATADDLRPSDETAGAADRGRLQQLHLEGHRPPLARLRLEGELGPRANHGAPQLALQHKDVLAMDLLGRRAGDKAKALLRVPRLDLAEERLLLGRGQDLHVVGLDALRALGGGEADLVARRGTSTAQGALQQKHVRAVDGL
mmetsp:Transcript_105351/g.267730  ORF Transcript_105351/g.267730 Transcript_105351/m.267730 type:complete len:261 (-) Transcript_105351:217-999(-)